MAKKPETGLQSRIQEALKATFPGIFVFKVHGGPFQVKGLPDLIGCLDGKFFGIEVKMPGEDIKAHQEKKLQEIALAGGIAGWATTIEEAIDVLRPIRPDAEIRRRRVVKVKSSGLFLRTRGG